MSVMPSRHVNVTEGNSLTLRCDAIGLPTPSVIWLNETGDGIGFKNYARFLLFSNNPRQNRLIVHQRSILLRFRNQLNRR